jgi:Putative lumazine-binding
MPKGISMMSSKLLQRHMRLAALIYLLLFVSVASAGPGSTASANPDLAAAREAVEAYFRAADSGRADNVRSVFLPAGRIEGVQRGAFLSWSADEFATRNFKGKPPASAATIQRTIEWLDISGPGAVARVTAKLGTNTYTDYFILFKAEGEWKIGLKAFANP